MPCSPMSCSVARRIRSRAVAAGALRGRPAQTGGVRRAQRSTASSWAARASSRGSLSAGPSSCAPTGRPSSVRAGGHVHARPAEDVPRPGVRAGADDQPCRSPSRRGRRSTPIGSGGCAVVGVSTTSARRKIRPTCARSGRSSARARRSSGPPRAAGRCARCAAGARVEQRGVGHARRASRATPGVRARQEAQRRQAVGGSASTTSWPSPSSDVGQALARARAPAGRARRARR